MQARMKARRPGRGTVVVWTRGVAVEVVRLVRFRGKFEGAADGLDMHCPRAGLRPEQGRWWLCFLRWGR